MGLRNFSQFANAAAAEEGWRSFIYKSSTPAPGQGAWFDASMGAGIPKYNAYVGGQLEATPFIGARNDSIYLGPTPESGKAKYLHRAYLHATGGTSGPFSAILCDYLLFYPLVDLDNTDLQEMDNTQTLPRYTDGKGVRLGVVVTTPMAVNANMTVNYVDVDDAAQSATFSLIANTVTGAVASSSNVSSVANSRSPFAPIAPRGIKSITSVKMASGAGGFCALVLLKPLATVQNYEVQMPSEIEFFREMARLPKLEDGAFLNFFCLQGGTGGLITLTGQLETVIA